MLVGADEARLVWRNGEGGLTFRFSSDAGDRFLTWVPGGQRHLLVAAAERARWVADYLLVPHFSAICPGLGGWWMRSAAIARDPEKTAFYRLLWAVG